jgi:CRISPR/Cas system CSM-associated protein Csm2 small subunit
MAREDLEIVIGASLEGLSSDLARAARMVRALGKEVEKNQPQWRGMSVANSAVNTFRGLAGSALRAGAGIRSAAGDMSGFVAKSAVAALTLRAVDAGLTGIGDAIRHVKDSVRMAAELEQTTLAFEVMLGSAEKAGATLAGLRKYAAESPFSSKDVIGGGRQLLAYGVAADQIIPSLKMLGDVSAGFGKDLPLNDLVYLYGTLFAQQRAYSVDVKQFAGRGIPIYESLAAVVGKSVDEIKDLIEQGGIGRDQITAAFKAMTGEGGKFYRMTERQAETLAGTWEQMADAFDLAKVKFGQIIIRETGLKEIVKNQEAFGNVLERNMERIAPFVRFVGDLARAAGQVAYELGRAAVTASDFAGVLGDAAAPGIKKRFKELQEYLQGIRKDFRLDPVLVADTIHHVADRLAQLFIDTLKGIKDIGETMRDEVLVPIRKAFLSILQTWAEAKNLVRDDVPADQLYSAPAFFEKDDKILKRFGKLWDEQKRLTVEEQKARELDLSSRNERFLPNEPPPLTDDEIGPLQQKVRDRVKELDKQRFEFLKAFDLPPLEAQHKLYVEGVVPNMPSRGDTALGPNGGLQRRIEGLEAGRKRMDDAFKVARGNLVQQEATKNADTLRVELLGPTGRAMLGPFAQAAGQLPDGYTRGGSGAGVKLMGDPRPGTTEAAKELRERFDPFAPGGKLMEYKADLEDAVARGKVTREMADMGWRDSVRGVADRLGVGQPAKLSDAVQVGTQEDARLLSQFATGNATQTTEGLLTEIRDYLQSIAGTNRRMEEAPMPRPVSVAVPGGG